MKTVTSDVIETLKYMLSTFPESNSSDLVSIQAEKYKLTRDFINEFYGNLTKEAFSTSPDLEWELIKEYPEFFDYIIWLRKTNKTLEPLLHDDFVKLYSVNVEEVITTASPKSLSIEIFKKYFSVLNHNARSVIINSSVITNEELVRLYPALVNENIFSNLYAKIDWTNDLIEHVMKNKELNGRFVTLLLSRTKDMAFIERMLTTESFTYKQEGSTFDTELKNFLLNIPAVLYEAVFNVLRKYSPNAISYEVLQFILSTNDFLPEKFIIDNLSAFMANGLRAQVIDYVRYHQFKAAMIVLKLV